MARTFKVDGTAAEEAAQGGQFTPYPSGDYVGEIIDVKDSFAANSGPNRKPTINVTFRIVESGTGKGVGKKFTAWRVPAFDKWASGKVAFQFYQFWKAVGVEFPKAGESAEVELPDNEDLMGELIGFELFIEDDNKGQPRNNVRRFFPASEGVRDSTPAATSNGDLDTVTDLVL